MTNNPDPDYCGIVVMDESDAIERVAKAMQRARDEIGATEQQRIAFAYAEAAMRSELAKPPLVGDDAEFCRKLCEPHFIKDGDFALTPHAVLNSHSIMRQEREQAATRIQQLSAEVSRLMELVGKCRTCGKPLSDCPTCQRDWSS